MGFRLPTYISDYGRTETNIYCCVYNINYNAVEKTLDFSMRPYISREIKNNGFNCLPIAPLSCGDRIHNVEHEDNFLRTVYLWIKEQIVLASEPDAALKATGYYNQNNEWIDPDYTYERALVWLPYKDAIDVLEEE